MPRNNWSREELIIAFNLYCKIPFGKIHIRNPQIIALAHALGRTPSSVSWKLANFARLDPSLKARKIAGAAHGSRLEQQIWDEFSRDWNGLTLESESLLARITGIENASTVAEFPEGKSYSATVQVRINQSFFRSAVLASYNSRCCITGLGVPALLNASHIVPWRVDVSNRTNPRNGLCLNTLHDRAFDCGLITVTPEFKVKISPRIAGSKEDSLQHFVTRFEGVTISLSTRFRPDPEFLKYHNCNVFLAN